MEKTILSDAGVPKHVQVQRSSFIDDDTAFIEAIPGIVFAVVISYVYLNVGTYMNGTLGSELVDSFGAEASRTGLENNSVNTMSNLSENYDSNVDIIKIAITISILLVPIMAIMSLRRIV
ncbi:unnamed protein product [marine sediment metagenome]|uniref:Uncharacterized protein n=1 Tax=marine sediment metagenome TaxID=412755 RepID=X1GHK0_9ZZZZ